MGPGLVEISTVLGEDATEGHLAENQDMIEAFSTDAAEHPFADRILLARQQHLVRRMEHNSSK